MLAFNSPGASDSGADLLRVLNPRQVETAAVDVKLDAAGLEILWRMVVAGGHVKPRRSGSEFQLRQVDRGRGIGSPQENVIERLVIHHGIYQIEVQAASRVSNPRIRKSSRAA